MAINAKTIPNTEVNTEANIEANTSTTPSSTSTSTTTAVDDFPDLEALRLPQTFTETGGVRKLLTTVPVRTPHAHDFNRVHPDPAYRQPLAIIRLRDERDERFLLTAEMAAAMPDEITMTTVFAAINRQGNVFLWPVPLPAPDGRTNMWHRSAADAVEVAMTRLSIP
jgi:hypothetical protein